MTDQDTNDQKPLHWKTKQKLEKENEVRGTKPGWRPASILPQLKAKEGFKAKWVRNEPGNIQRKQVEGWVIMTPKDNVGIEIRGEESASLGSEVRYRDMIAMMLPDDLVEARREYYRNESKSAQKQILQKSDQDFKASGVQTYTPKGQGGRIVID